MSSPSLWRRSSFAASFIQAILGVSQIEDSCHLANPQWDRGHGHHLVHDRDGHQCIVADKDVFVASGERGWGQFRSHSSATPQTKLQGRPAAQTPTTGQRLPKDGGRATDRGQFGSHSSAAPQADLQGRPAAQTPAQRFPKYGGRVSDRGQFRSHSFAIPRVSIDGRPAAQAPSSGQILLSDGVREADRECSSPGPDRGFQAFDCPVAEEFLYLSDKEFQASGCPVAEEFLSLSDKEFQVSGCPVAEEVLSLSDKEFQVSGCPVAEKFISGGTPTLTQVDQISLDPVVRVADGEKFSGTECSCSARSQTLSTR